MNLQNKLQQFRDDNPYDNHTIAKRLYATEDKALIIYVLELGLQAAKQRKRHEERSFIKNMGFAKPKERLAPHPSGVTGAVIRIKTGPKTRNALQEMLLDVWRINGEQKLGDANRNDLASAIKRETSSSVGHSKNAEFYAALRKQINDNDVVRQHFDEASIRSEIEKVYGEFRKSEAA
jgi:hypothetical protein